MQQTKRLKLTTSQTLYHYNVALFLLIPSAMMGWYTPIGSLPFLLITILCAIIQYRRLRFTEVSVTITDEQFREAIQRTKDELFWVGDVDKKWRKNDRNGNIFFRIYDAEMVTIIKEKDRLLINSIDNPDGLNYFSPSYGHNKKNIRTFLQNLSDVLSDKSVVAKVEEKVNEWSVKKIITRLFLYPFSVFMVVFGLYMVLQPQVEIQRLFGIGIMALGGIYLYADIRVLMMKNKKVEK
jgi:Ca2+/Na+ antiporter